MSFRIEKDSLGPVKISNEKYWGAQTERSRNNFKIGAWGSMPIEIIYALAIVKKACAKTNHHLGVLEQEKMELIVKVCDELMEGKLDDHFPLVIWQTGSGTQTNMNVNEVIANRAHHLQGNVLGEGKKMIHPNDMVNKSQSSNDVFPTAMYIAAFQILSSRTIPSLEKLQASLNRKAKEFHHIIKLGRTHLMDATPLRLGQEFSAYGMQLQSGIKVLKQALESLSKLALGGTAVGTGLNAPKNFDILAIQCIAEITQLPFKPAENKFEAISAHNAIVQAHAALKQIAVSLLKIANDVRLLGSGPRGGFAELILPANEPGSSIMPGKVNPTQCEAITMVATKIMGNDVSVSIANANGHLQLNALKPLMASNLIESAGLLADACICFEEKCIRSIKANESAIKKHIENSLMLVTALNNHIGYDKAAQIAKKAYRENISLKKAAIDLSILTAASFDQWVDPEKMLGEH